jgi:hypothetical protein
MDFELCKINNGLFPSSKKINYLLFLFYKMGEDGESLGVVQTESKGTATSASLYRMQNIMDAQDTLQVGC